MAEPHTRSCGLTLSLSPLSSQAQAVTLTVAQAFKIAFEFWQAAKEGEASPLFPLFV